MNKECLYCSEDNTYKDGIGDWICYKNPKDELWYVYTEMFRCEYSEFQVNYCPNCGRILNK